MIEKWRKHDVYYGYDYYYKLKGLIKSGKGNHDIRSSPEYKLLATINPHLAEALAIENEIINLKHSLKNNRSEKEKNGYLNNLKLQNQIRKLELKKDLELNKAKARLGYIDTMSAWKRKRTKEIIIGNIRKMPNKVKNKVNDFVTSLIARGIEKTAIPYKIEEIVKSGMNQTLKDLVEEKS
ncbi:MAG: hypothetical protein QXI36_05105 [Candidatus Bathyarchaeia archaeon]